MKAHDLSLVEAHQRIDRLCDEFEAAWNRCGGRIDIEQWILQAPESLRPRLFPELVAIDLAMRSAQEETLSSVDFQSILSLAGDGVAGPLRSELGDAQHDTVCQSAEAVRRALLCCSTFEGLPEATAKALGERLVVRQYAKGETLLQQDGPAGGLNIILDGYLEVWKYHQGENRLIARASRGSLIGEMSLLTGQNCTATVITSTQVTALVLSNEDYFQLRSQFPELEIAISQLVSDRLGARQHDSLCGRNIGGYEIVRCINRGGMGVVYEARSAEHPESPPVALKMLRHRYVHDVQAVKHFEREGKVLMKLRHPNLIAVQECFVAYNTRFLAMDFCDGDDLSRLLHRHGPLPEPLVRRLLGQIVAGLSYVHSQGVIHMDLKPANILVRRDGTAAVADFGLSQILGTQRAWKIVRGTPAYMAPEQLAGKKVGFPGDWYALGCLAYELLTNKKLFSTRDPIELSLVKFSHQPSRDWPELSVSDELRQTIVDTLHIEPNARRLDIELVTRWAGPVPELFS